MINSDLVHELREMATKGLPVCDMVTTIISRLGLPQDARVHVIAHLRTAFDLGIADLMPIGAWSFFPGGTWSREEVEQAIMPLIMKNRDKWGLAQ